MPAPGPIGALTVGTTAAGLALVVFGDHPEAAAQAADRLGVAAVAGEPHPDVQAVGAQPGAHRTAGVSPAEGRAAGVSPAEGRAAGVSPAEGRAAGVQPRAHRAAAVSPAVGRAAGALPAEDGAAGLAAALAQLREYLAGDRRVFDLPLDWSLTRGSQRRVLATLYTSVGYGETVTYGELAARSELGSAYTAARGVGAIMGSNPLPVVVPCHRVMAADGLGGFGGGRATKEWLLALEGVLTPALDFDA
jgi:methylated-DNA-[protein]-cysteine S-methyltransferase